MTREEKIKMLETEKAYMIAHGGDRQAEALTSAIQALKKEPCTDSVSVEAVIEWLKDKDIIKLKSQEENARKELQQVYSVKPQPKTGHWKSTIDGKPICSECGLISESKDGYFVSHYCPNCGARMESEEV